jgi:hypothetical protein
VFVNQQTRGLIVNLGQLRTLIGLRYRLIWAHARSGNGRLVLLVVGYLVVASAAVVFVLGGIGAAAGSIRAGRGMLTAQIVLAGIYVNATIGAVLLGILVNQVFSDPALRRYPLSTADRWAARHVTALLEPLWLLVFALALGLAAGFWMSGQGSPLAAVPAAGLYVVTSYLLACVLSRLVALIVSMPAGPLLIVAAGTTLIMVVPLLPTVLARATARLGASWFGFAVLGATPPFAAVTAMASTAYVPAFLGLLILIGWTVGLGVLLIAVERLPLHTRAIASARATWDHPCDSIAAIFGRRRAPLAGKMLRYFVRSAIRYNYPFVLPVLALMSRNYDVRFLFALGVAPTMAFAATQPLSLNLFGVDGLGFRRYFLLPMSGADVFTTAALVGLIPGAILIPIGLALYLIFPGTPVDGRMIAMLLAASFGGLLLFHALGLWTSVLSPRAIPFGIALGNKNSPAANLLMIASWILLLGLPAGLTLLDVDTVLGFWWMAPVFLLGGTAAYLATIRVGARVFVRRREEMIDLLERQT